jgi:hypothetical protein
MRLTASTRIKVPRMKRPPAKSRREKENRNSFTNILMKRCNSYAEVLCLRVPNCAVIVKG